MYNIALRLFLSDEEAASKAFRRCQRKMYSDYCRTAMVFRVKAMKKM